MEDIIQIKKGLSDHELAVLSSEMEKHKKSMGLAYVLWFFFGFLGVHKFYIGKKGMGILYLALGLGSLLILLPITLPISHASEASAAPFIIVAIPLIILSILLLIDLFTLPRQLRKKHEAIEHKLLAEIRIKV